MTSFIQGFRDYVEKSTNFKQLIDQSQVFSPEAKETLEKAASEFSNIYSA